MSSHKIFTSFLLSQFAPHFCPRIKCMEFRIKSSCVCFIIEGSLTSAQSKGNLSFFNFPILWIIHELDITLTFLYGSCGKGRHRRFGAQSRCFSRRHSWVSLSFHGDVGLNCVPAQRLSTSVLFWGSLGYDSMLLSFRGHRFC